MKIHWNQAAITLWVMAASAAPPANLVRRLTHAEYNNSVRDLLGDETRPADAFPPEDFLNGFKNQSAAQDISPLLAEAYAGSAERLAKNAFQGGQDNSSLLPCKPRSASDAACAAQFVERFGLRAFRRPLTGTEVQRYQALLAKQAARAGDFLEGAQAVVEAMLQSPKFLFRLERGPQAGARAYEIAARLSYFLWDTMPDEALFRAAAAGELETPAGVEKAVRRMLADPRARQSVDEFVVQWLRFDLALNAVKDRETYPQFTPELAQAMTEETRRLIGDVVWNDRSFMEIFTAGYAFLNADLAALYGVPAPANEFDRVSLPRGVRARRHRRRGALPGLTSKPGGNLAHRRAAFSCASSSSASRFPILLPASIRNLPPVSRDKPLTNRERMQAHVASPSCAGCHSLMDPVGFGSGEVRRHRPLSGEADQSPSCADHGHRNGRSPIKVQCSISIRAATSPASPHADFSTPRQLGQLLAASPLCQECMVRQLFRYACGRKETSADAPVIRKGLEVFRNSRFRLKELMMFLAGSLAFEGGES